MRRGIGARCASTLTSRARSTAAAEAAPRSHLLRSARATTDAVEVEWDDGCAAAFHHTWLRDHCPGTIHPTTQQRNVPLASIPRRVAPDEIALGGDGESLQLLWPEGGGALPPASAFASRWLRRHAYSGNAAGAPPAELVSASARDVAAAAAAAGGGDLGPLRLWGAKGLCGAPAEWAALVDERRRGVLGPHRFGALARLRRDGACLVDGVPPTMDATEELARCFGPPLETFYGRMWDTAPKAAAAVNDTAYSNVELPLHTDCAYLRQPPGLQLFHCVAQAIAEEGDAAAAGNTRLCDGFAVAEELRRRSPDAFAFFCAAPIPFECREAGVHVRSLAPVFDLEPRSGALRCVRYNETDRGTLDCLGFDETAAFYEHAAALHGAIAALETELRLDTGQAILIDNHRVMHGRRAFRGHRNLLGCYLPADDWQSLLRVARRERGEWEP